MKKELPEHPSAIIIIITYLLVADLHPFSKMNSLVRFSAVIDLLSKC